MLAGDIYDAPVPPAAACTPAGLVPDPAGRPAHRRCWPSPATTTAPSGWTSPAGLLAEPECIHCRAVPPAAPRQIVLNDRFGPVEFTLLPFVRAATVRHYLPDADLHRLRLRRRPPRWPPASPPPRAGCCVAHQMVVAGRLPARSSPAARPRPSPSARWIPSMQRGLRASAMRRSATSTAPSASAATPCATRVRRCATIWTSAGWRNPSRWSGAGPPRRGRNRARCRCTPRRAMRHT